VKIRSIIATVALSAVIATLSGIGAQSATAETATAAKPTSCTNKIVDAKAPVVTMWAWSPTAQVAVDAFNKAHKDVQVCWTNSGAGSAEYDKFTTAITAGTGAPDVIMLETAQLNSFEIKNALVNMSKYGANRVRSHFGAGTLKDITNGTDHGIYAIPDDGGPVALMYRKDIFDKYGLTPPKTWAEYASDAQKLKDAGGPMMGDWPSDTQDFTQAMLLQKGTQIFDYNLAKKTQLGVNINNPSAKSVLSYWTDLVKKKLVDTTGEQTTDFTTGLVNGKYASLISPSWNPGHLVAAGIKPGPDSPWRVAMLPQWNTKKPVQVNWGGSTYAVTSQSTHKKLATEVAVDLFDNETQTTIGAHFPLHLKAQKASWFKDAKDPFFGNQQANKEVWIPTAAGYKGAGYSPFQNYYYTQMTAQLNKTIDGSVSASKALDNLQASITKYAKSQGFSVHK
jgi:multiple sugar transport system substrate-binding protein